MLPSQPEIRPVTVVFRPVTSTSRCLTMNSGGVVRQAIAQYEAAEGERAAAVAAKQAAEEELEAAAIAGQQAAETELEVYAVCA